MGVSRNNGRGSRLTREGIQRPTPKRTSTSDAVGLRRGFRSGLEDRNAEKLRRLGVKVEYESLKIPYTKPASEHNYTPDFPLPNGILVETKGLFELNDRAKHIFIKHQHPHLDIRFVFQRPSDKIYKGSKTTYAEWCDKNGFKYAAREIPAEWLQEPGPDIKPWGDNQDGR